MMIMQKCLLENSLNDPFMIYLDKVKGDKYLDWVTGRPFDYGRFG